MSQDIDVTTGLSQDEAQARQKQHGPNILPEKPPTPIALIFIRQFNSPFVYVLLTAALFSYVLGQGVNTFFIMVVLAINAVIGTVQEYSAERAATALKEMVPGFATVIRDGRQQKIRTQEVVPGDVILLAPGDKCPADIRLHECIQLQVDESMLTGESLPAHKSAVTTHQTDAMSEDNACYAGTVVMRGRGCGIVFATGVNTAIGKIATEVKEEQTKPPLLIRIEQFTQRITWGILLLIALIFVITLVRGDDLGTVFLLAVALAVSAIPEGLPAAMTVTLAVGMRRMARAKVIIRNLLAVESLGSCTYIASDKTGTLTVNEMTIQRLESAAGSSWQVKGEGLDLHGEIEMLSQHPAEVNHQEALTQLCLAGALANESGLKETEQGWEAQGDMVDVAFLVLAAKNGMDYRQLKQQHPELDKIPYESEQAYCASINRFDGASRVYVKGSVEALAKMCQSDQNIESIRQCADALAAQGYRVLGLASTTLNQIPADPTKALNQLTLLGIAAMIDPLRPDVVEAVSDCKAADIKVAMITGDHPQTALAVARQAGICDQTMTAVTGMLLDEIKDNKVRFAELVRTSRVFARVTPSQKKQIVVQFMADGDYVALTGDGVNDAPALSHAHVGIAMGYRGTDVARESADLILTDDHFASIVQGIKQGRIVYSNIRKVIFLLISTGAAEILLVLYSLLFNKPIPLFPLQLLWLNLVTNGIQDKALAFEPAEGNELKQPARAPGEPIFDRLMIERVVTNALVMGTLAFAVFSWYLAQGLAETEARNLTLLLMVLFENVHVLNSRSETQSMFKQDFFSNKLLLFGMLTAQAIHIGAMYTPVLSDTLQIQPVSFAQWANLLFIALSLIVVDETHKYWHARRTLK